MAREKISIFEVGPRDGLQNEPRAIPLRTKIEFISGLIGSGLRDLEVGAFVRPDRVPQMADTDKIFQAIRKERLNVKGARFWSLVPNRKGLERALRSGAQNVAVFTAATESFAKKNIGMSIRESLAEFDQVIREARRKSARGVHVRGYVSTTFGCPFEGKVAPKKALKVIEALADLGVQQISIGDTIGVATPSQVTEVIRPALRMLGPAKVAVHFHDTRGTALANCLRAFELGVRVFDSSAGGLGGCPFAPGATGNVATEDLVYMFDGMKVSSQVDLERLCKTSLKLAHQMRRPLSSRYLMAYAARCRR